jgi:hypothetical protein
MAKHSFGVPPSEDDILEVQGVDYPMNPIGMRAMRKLLTLQKHVAARKDDEPVGEEELDLAMEIVIGSVRPEYREKFRDHIDDSVPPGLLIQIASAVMGAFSDVDPTQPESSSGGSTTTGSGSVDGAPDMALTPTA